ncbi:hypothetical protein BC936DRAFT_149996 [Jimgerdemannia flammicorona]|uniref:Nucleoporin Pom152 n=1 Tax=Jimgerdemannia flammicorona TaxID=994334 RepID=A0A433DJR1_9FUNG|nr:hypothetical protein BC936DRAFT_149996 [Jimgerdemannia flammicorona]
MASPRPPVVPLQLIDAPSQRKYAFSFFIALGIWKVIDLAYLYGESHTEAYDLVLAKWCIIDAFFLLMLWLLRIPWLHFSIFSTSIGILSLWLLDAVLFSLPTATWSDVLNQTATGGAMLGQQLAISRAGLIRVRDVIFNSSHLMGKHTVQILPYSTAKLNPENRYFCIPKSDIGHKDVLIPVQFNNTIPRTVQLLHVDLATGSRTAKNLTYKDLQRASEISSRQQGLETYFIRVRRPGVYSLERVVAQDRTEAKLYRKEALIVVCPQVEYLHEPYSSDKCIGEHISFSLTVRGLPPLKVSALRQIDGARTAMDIDNIQPPNYHSPLTAQTESQQRMLSVATADKYEWAAEQVVNLPINVTLDNPAEYVYTIQSVSDGCGNTVEFPQPVTSIEHSTPQQKRFTVHQSPTAKFLCHPSNPVKLLIGSGSASTGIPLKVTGEKPWTIRVEFNPYDVPEVLETKDLTVHSPDDHLPVDLPGRYTLISVRDKYCEGDVMFPSRCEVVQPPLPSCDITTTPIRSQCVKENEIGMNVVVELHGTAPFHLSYNIIKDPKTDRPFFETKTEKVDQSRHIMTFAPNDSGCVFIAITQAHSRRNYSNLAICSSYTYEFFRLEDAHYKDVKLEKSITQVVHPQPNAAFLSIPRGSLKTCIGETIELEVELTGSAPFTLYWTVFFEGVRHKYTEPNLKGPKFTIQSPVLTVGGAYTVSLAKIEDANGCSKDLDSPDVVIDVRRERPTASFYYHIEREAAVTVLEGAEARLPLRLTGEKPWHVSYRNLDADSSNRHSARIDDPNGFLTVRHTGGYELLEVNDADCPGDVSTVPYKVSWIPRPTLNIPADQALLRRDGVFVRNDVCEGVDDAVDLELKGHPPFFVSYDRQFQLQGKQEYYKERTEELRSGLASARVHLKTSPSGNYRYVFTKIADDFYTNPFQPLFEGRKPLILEQHVNARPSARFTKKPKKNHHHVCVGDRLSSKDLNAITTVELAGRPPFSVDIEIKHDSQLKGVILQVSNITEETHVLDLPFTFSTPGIHQMTITRVEDAGGCRSEPNARQENAVALIEASDIATITPADTSHIHCVGDVMEFALSGLSPFTITYMFDNKRETVKATTPRFSTIADKPGNFTILSVGDQRNKCKSFPKDVSKIIHDLPTAIVSGGMEIIENIHEGDMSEAIVDLIGTPPFEFEWVRSEAIYDLKKKIHRKGRILETHVITNVMKHKYSIFTSQEGTIEVVSIKDRYCQYPRV